MTFPIQLQIFFNTDETMAKKKVDIDYKLTDCDLREMTFYRIDAIAPHIEENDEIDCSEVFVGGASFVCILTYDELKERLSYPKANS